MLSRAAERSRIRTRIGSPDDSHTGVWLTQYRSPRKTRMRLLILGGTLFLGRHLVDAARERGHEITLFNRGRTNPGLYPEVETVLGDRAADLALLKGRSWDAVVDTCGYLPGVVRASAERLRDAVEHYTFISSISVYADPVVAGVDETPPPQQIDDELVHEFKPEHYGR
jgi:2'-hydroxyisoflavone reductase